MRLFKCPACAQLLYFENTRCEQCGHRLGYDPAQFMLRALDQDGELWSDPTGGWKFCANAEQEACNWLLPSEFRGKFLPGLPPQPYHPRPLRHREPE